MTIAPEHALEAARWSVQRAGGPADAAAKLATRLQARAVDVRDPANLGTVLARIGAFGREQAEAYATARYDWFTDATRGPGGQRWIRALALALWHDEVCPEIERRGAPAVVAPVARTIGALRRSTYTAEAGVTPSPLQLAPCAPADLARALPGLDLLGGVTAQRLVRWMVRAAFEADDDLVVRIPGGWAALAEQIGAGANKAREELHDLCDTLVRTVVDWRGPAGEGCEALLAGWRLTPAAPGRAAVLELRLSRLLAPGLVHRIPKRHPDRALVPVLPMPALDAVGPRLRPAAARLDWLAVTALRRLAADLVEHGGARLDWPRLAERAGFPVERLGELLDAWTTGDAPRWRRVGAARWILAGCDDDTRAALAFLFDAGRAARRGRRAGRASAATRSRKHRGNRQ